MKEVEEYRRLFRTVDSDGSGEIDEGEVEEVRRGEGGGEKARMGGWFCCFVCCCRVAGVVAVVSSRG